jgi:NADPH:quinone reductase-like Zn-dependent oxidoreductase
MAPNMVEAYQIHHKASSHDEYDASILSNLSIQAIPKPRPGPKSALVRLRAASLNFRDLLIIADSPNYPNHTAPGLTPCSDGAGEIEAVGPGSEWKVGDKVILHPNQSWYDSEDVGEFQLDKALGGASMQGTLQQYRVVEDKWLNRMPKNLSFEEAAALPTAGGTAINALYHSRLLGPKGGKLLQDKAVLTQGTGGVSCFAIQLASAAGARVIATSSTEEKLKAAKAMGATDLVNYKATPEWADEVLQLTGGKGVDLVIEVGGAATIEQSLKATRQGGTIVIIGVLTASKQTDLVPAILFGAKTGMLRCGELMQAIILTMISNGSFGVQQSNDRRTGRTGREA